MGRPAAKQGDRVVGTDIHVVMVPAPPGPPVPTPLPHPFVGRLTGALSATVKVEGRPAATVGSTAANLPPHLPTPPGTTFQKPPKNSGKVTSGSPTVRIGGKAAARLGDPVETCNDPADRVAGQVVAIGTVRIG